MKPTVVIAERSAELADAIRKHLVAVGCQVVATCHDGLEALRQTRQLRPQYLMLDSFLPPLSYVEVADALRRAGVTVTIVPTSEAMSIQPRKPLVPDLRDRATI